MRIVTATIILCVVRFAEGKPLPGNTESTQMTTVTEKQEKVVRWLVGPGLFDAYTDEMVSEDGNEDTSKDIYKVDFDSITITNAGSEGTSERPETSFKAKTISESRDKVTSQRSTDNNMPLGPILATDHKSEQIQVTLTHKQMMTSVNKPTTLRQKSSHLSTSSTHDSMSDNTSLSALYTKATNAPISSTELKHGTSLTSTKTTNTQTSSTASERSLSSINAQETINVRTSSSVPLHRASSISSKQTTDAWISSIASTLGIIDESTSDMSQLFIGDTEHILPTSEEQTTEYSISSEYSASEETDISDEMLRSTESSYTPLTESLSTTSVDQSSEFIDSQRNKKPSKQSKLLPILMLGFIMVVMAVLSITLAYVLWQRFCIDYESSSSSSSYVG